MGKKEQPKRKEKEKGKKKEGGRKKPPSVSQPSEKSMPATVTAAADPSATPESTPSAGPEKAVPSPGERVRSAAEKAKRVEAYIRERVHGQPEAVRALGRLAYQVALHEPRKRPLLATFLGPPAVGKSMAAFAFADAIRTLVLDDPKAGATEYVDAQRYAGSRGDDLWGSYGRLTKTVSKHPRSVVIVDEMEKGSTDFLMSWLQVLGNGFVLAGMSSVDFSRSVILLTTNLGHEAYRQAGGGPHTVDLWDLLAEAKRPHEEKQYWASPALPRELVSRLSQGEGVMFSALQGQHRARIVLDALVGGGDGEQR